MWPKASVAVAVIALGVIVGVAASAVIGRTRGDVERASASASDAAAPQPCDGATEPLDIAADDAVVPILRELADRYIADLADAGRECVDIRVRAVASAAVVGRLGNEWRARIHGPTPEVWIPQSSVWVQLLRAELDNPEIVEPEPTVLARSPTVLAMPEPMATAVGWPDQEPSWQRVVELADVEDSWASLGHPEWGRFDLWSTDPRYTTLGLQTLLALGGADTGDQEDIDPLLRLFRVQRLLSAIDASTGMQVERYAGAAALAETASAFPLEERQVWEYNRTHASGQRDGPSSSPSGAADAAATTLPPLAATHPTGNEQVALESDYPYVLLDAPWVARDVLQYAEEFGDYLLGDVAQRLFVDAGFRPPDNSPTDVLRADERLQVDAAPAGRVEGSLPDIAALQQLRSSWVNVPRLSTTLLAVDVSGSMKQIVPGTDRTRLQATVDAARQTLDIVPPAGSVGVWEFSTGLPGGEQDGDYRELVTVGPLDEPIDGRPRRQRLVAALEGLEPRNDTALNDTVIAAYRDMQSRYEAGNSHTVILLTDGRNDDPDSRSHEQTVEALERLRDVKRPVRIVSIAYGDQTDIAKLEEFSEVTGGEVLASPELRNLDELFIEALSGANADP